LGPLQQDLISGKAGCGRFSALKLSFEHRKGTCQCIANEDIILDIAHVPMVSHTFTVLQAVYGRFNDLKLLFGNRSGVWFYLASASKGSVLGIWPNLK